MRINVIAEGQAEEAFVNRILVPHYAHQGIYFSVRCVLQIGKTQSRIHKGGFTSYEKVRKDISRWLREDRNTDVRFTSMLDLYALPEDFPGQSTVAGKAGHLKAQHLQEALYNDIADRRFIPYIQLHEFEALLLAQPEKLVGALPDCSQAIEALCNEVRQFDNPEDINDSKETAPSKRILRHIPQYKKRVAGVLTAEAIGLQKMREKCPNFAAWLERIENDASQPKAGA